MCRANAGAHNFLLGGKLLAVAVPCGSQGTRNSNSDSESDLRQGILTFIFITRAYLFNCFLISETRNAPRLVAKMLGKLLLLQQSTKSLAS